MFFRGRQPETSIWKRFRGAADGFTFAEEKDYFTVHMVANAGRAISAEEFRLQLFRSQHDRSSSNVRRQIHALRQLLENAHSGLAEIIENVPGVGYGVGIRRKIAG